MDAVDHLLSAPESEFSGEEAIWLEMLRDAALKWATAVAAGYVDPASWQIRESMVKARRNGNLVGGFGAEFSRADLHDLRAFWLSDSPNRLFCNLGGTEKTLDEWRRYIMRVQRSTRRFAPRPRKMPTNPVWANPRAIERIRSHPSAPRAASSVYYALCEIERARNVRSKKSLHQPITVTRAEIGNVSGFSAPVVGHSINALAELRVIDCQRRQHGLEVRLLNC